MARGYRSRRYRPSRRSARRFKKSSSLRKVKKDILKCNFPTKVKFLGLSEKKVMFLKKSTTISLATENQYRAAIQLNPLVCPNVKSLMKPIGNVKYTNWDKFCILGIYIKMQPQKNQWTGDGAAINTIQEVKCTYTYNNCPRADQAAYDHNNIDYKQVFTFNSNEAFTIYIPAPPTMTYRDAYVAEVKANANLTGNVTGYVQVPQESNCVVHKSKTWWSLADLKSNMNGDANFQDVNDEEIEDEISDEQVMDEDMIGTPYTNELNPIVHAGRIFFETDGDVKYNVTINYKVALKG